MVSYTDCLPFPLLVGGSDATTRFVEGRGMAYPPSSSRSGRDCWWEEVSLLHSMAQESVGVGVAGVMLAHTPCKDDDLKF